MSPVRIRVPPLVNCLQITEERRALHRIWQAFTQGIAVGVTLGVVLSSVPPGQTFETAREPLRGV